VTRRWPAEVAHRPVCPKRDLPIPFINEVAPDGTGMFTILDDRQATKCLRGRLCAVCGRRMGAEVALVGDVVSLEPDGYFIEAPVHERCADLAILGEDPGDPRSALCPYLSREQVPRRAHDDPTVAMVGVTPADLAEVGRSIAKRPVLVAIAASYGPVLVASTGGSPVLVYQAGPVIRVRLFGYDRRGRAVEVQPPAWLIPAPPPAVRVVRTQRRVASKRRR
jgi:hypothetical protein